MSAVAVSHMYKYSPETIRKLWRGETYRQDTAPKEPTFSGPVPEGTEELLKQLMGGSPEGEGK